MHSFPLDSQACNLELAREPSARQFLFVPIAEPEAAAQNLPHQRVVLTLQGVTETTSGGTALDLKGKSCAEAIGAHVTVWYKEKAHDGRAVKVPYVGVVTACNLGLGLSVRFAGWPDEELVNGEDEWRWGEHVGSRRPPARRAADRRLARRPLTSTIRKQSELDTSSTAATLKGLSREMKKTQRMMQQMQEKINANQQILNEQQAQAYSGAYGGATTASGGGVLALRSPLDRPDMTWNQRQTLMKRLQRLRPDDMFEAVALLGVAMQGEVESLDFNSLDKEKLWLLHDFIEQKDARRKKPRKAARATAAATRQEVQAQETDRQLEEVRQARMEIAKQREAEPWAEQTDGKEGEEDDDGW